jgi:predicted  nucleic acid-binding Zn-ribbon protein
MSQEDAPKLNHGKLDFHRDVLPLLEEKKSKWRAKLHRLQSEKEKISQDLVQLDIKLRNMESEKVR